MAAISVIIPNFNRVSLVGDTIENMLGQTIAPSEVIVVDDGSTDNSRDVIRAFGNRVRLIEQTNQGPGAARNAGFAASRGDYVQFMDSDDLASQNKLATQLAALKQSNADFAYCPWVRTTISGKQMRFIGPVMQGGPLPDWKPMLEWQMGPWCLVFQNCLFRRRILLQAGKFRTDLMPSEDSEYLVRVLLAGARPIYTGDCLVFYRSHDQGQITGAGVNARKRADDWTRYFQVVSEEISDRIESFNSSTRREIALTIYRHNQYCRKQGWPGVGSEYSFSRLTHMYSPLHLICMDYFDRVQRKLRKLPISMPNSLGLCMRSANSTDWRLAKDLGFTVA